MHNLKKIDPPSFGDTVAQETHLRIACRVVYSPECILHVKSDVERL